MLLIFQQYNSPNFNNDNNIDTNNVRGKKSQKFTEWGNQVSSQSLLINSLCATKFTKIKMFIVQSVKNISVHDENRLYSNEIYYVCNIGILNNLYSLALIVC